MHAGSLAIGTKIGRFVIESLIGAGGMGEVYAARDTQLARTVALKILPASRAMEHDRVERFLREARAASSLNHPAIVTIFDSGSEALPGGEVIHYLAMELIEGPTLTEWMRSRRSQTRTLEVLAQVAEGLARAHSSGIVHRDLKPDNIMVARGGFAKIVDFGIAKLTERRDEGSAAGDTAPTAILGTTAFMSPEQVEGRPVDSRSDVFSFGCVLYAVFQGQSPFERGSAIRTMHAIANEAPPTLAEVPAAIERIARRCVAKDPEERYQSIKDVALDLREHMPSPEQLQSRHRLYRLLGGLAATMTFAGVAWFGARVSAARPPQTARSEARQMSMQRLTNSGKIATGGLSPDGKYVVYAAYEGDRQSLWLRQVATGTDIRMAPAAEGFYDDLRVSPDGNYAFYTYSSRQEPNVFDVYRIPILGGEPRKVMSDIEPGTTIAPDGHRIAARRFSAVTREQQLFVADIDTGTERLVLTKKFPEGLGSPTWTADGKRLTFIFGSQLSMRRPNIVDFDLATARMTRIASPEWSGFGGISWVPDGSGIVLTATAPQQPPQLWYLPYNDGPARKLTSDVAFYGGVSFTSDSKAFVTHRSEESANLWQVDLASGKSRALTTGLGSFAGSAGLIWLNPREVLYTFAGEGAPQFRVMNLANSESRAIPLTVGWRPALSPDKTKIAYVTAKEKVRVSNLWVADADGSNPRRVSEVPVSNAAPSWLPDSKSVIVVSSGKDQLITQIWIESGETKQVTDRPANSPAMSPDGQWILCRLRSLEPNVPLWRTALIRMDGTLPARFFDVPFGGGPHMYKWMPDGKSFAFLDTVNGVGNVFVQDLAGGKPRQVTRFDSGRVVAYDFAEDMQSIVVSKVERVNDLVLIRDFR